MKFFLDSLGKRESRKVFLVAVISTLTGLAYAFATTIWALYIDSFVNSLFLVGLISSLITALVFVSYFFVIPLIEKKDKVKLYSASLLFYVFAYLIFSVNSSLILFFIIIIPMAFSFSLRITSFGILVRNLSGRRNLSKNEGFLYSIQNSAWILGPLIAGYLLSSYGFKIVFLVSSGMMLVSLIILNLSKMKDHDIKKRSNTHLLKNFFSFFKKKTRVFAYLLSGGVSFWWALIYVFVPVYIFENGSSGLLIGYFLFAIPIPLVLTEFYFSSLASRKGFKKLFRAGYFIVAILALACFFVSNIYTILVLLVLASFGMAMLESTTESYFFDILHKKQHLKYYGPFNTADSVSDFTAKILSSAVLFFLPFKFLFILFSLFMFGYFVMTFFIRDSIEQRRNN